MICDGGLLRVYCSDILVIDDDDDIKPGPGVYLVKIHILFKNTKCKLTISTLSIKTLANWK